MLCTHSSRVLAASSSGTTSSPLLSSPLFSPLSSAEVIDRQPDRLFFFFPPESVS